MLQALVQRLFESGQFAVWFNPGVALPRQTDLFAC